MKAFVLLFSILLFQSCEKYTEEEVINLYANEGQNSKFLYLENKKVHYRIHGDEPETVVMVHGTADTLHTWDKVSEKLAENFKVITFDLPGFGLSDPLELDPANDDIVAIMVDQMRKILTELHIERFHVVGNSLGGLIAWMYGYTYPDEVEKIVLLGSAAFPQDIPWFFDYSNPIVNTIVRMAGNRVLLAPFLYEAATKLTTLLGPQDDVNYAKYQLLRFADLLQSEGNVKSYMDLCDAITAYDFRHAHLVKTLTQPVFVIFGEADTIVPTKQHLPLWQEALPNARYWIIPKGGHLVHWERPYEISLRIKEFILED